MSDADASGHPSGALRAPAPCAGNQPAPRHRRTPETRRDTPSDHASRWIQADLLADRFEAERPRLQAIAYRMLGSTSEAEDAVQECWLRLARADGAALENLG